MMGVSSSAGAAPENDLNSGDDDAALFEATPDDDGIWRDSK